MMQGGSCVYEQFAFCIGVLCMYILEPRFYVLLESLPHSFV